MSAGKDINKIIIADVAGRIERLIADARAHIARAVNITEVITKYEIGRIIVGLFKKEKNARHTGSNCYKV